MIGRNDVTGTRDVKITQFPRSPWRSAVASLKTWKSERRQIPERVGSFLFLSFYFFFKKFQFPVLASLRFLFVSATLTYSWQPTSVACRSASEVAEGSKPRVSHRSRRWRTRRKGRRRRRKKGSACFEREREREREREKRSKQKPGALVNLMWRFLFFSHQSTSRNPRSRMKTKLRLRYLLSDSTSHARLSFLVNWQDMITVCMTVCLDGNGNTWTRSPMLRRGLQLFHSESTIDLPRTGKIRW